MTLDRIRSLRQKIRSLETLSANPGASTPEATNAQETANKLRLELSGLLRKARAEGLMVDPVRRPQVQRSQRVEEDSEATASVKVGDRGCAVAVAIAIMILANWRFACLFLLIAFAYKHAGKLQPPMAKGVRMMLIGAALCLVGVIPYEWQRSVVGWELENLLSH